MRHWIIGSSKLQPSYCYHKHDVLSSPTTAYSHPANSSLRRMHRRSVTSTRTAQGTTKLLKAGLRQFLPKTTLPRPSLRFTPGIIATGTSATLLPPIAVPRRAMASNTEYIAFLNKANAQREAALTTNARPPETTTIKTEAVHVGVEVPAVLREVNEHYVSETDEPFEPVVLQWPGASRGLWPDADQFASLITGTGTAATAPNLSDSVSTLSPSTFDPRSLYTNILRVVREAAAAAAPLDVDKSDVDVKVYRVELDVSRLEYFIVALDVERSQIVGLRAKAVES